MFGHIEGISVGQIFSDRKEVAKAGIHTPLMSGIWGAQEGARTSSGESVRGECYIY